MPSTPIAPDRIAQNQIARDQIARDQIAYDRFGHGASVVLLHPTGLGPAVLVPFAERLAATHDVVVPHRRGYGRSAALDPARTLDDHVDDLAALLDDLAGAGPPAPVTLVGISAGATICLAYAARARTPAVRFLAHEPLFGPLSPSLHARVTGRIDRLIARADQPLELSLFISELIGLPTWNALPAAWRTGVEQNRAAALAEVGFYAAFALGDGELIQIGRRGFTTTVGARSSEARHEAADILRAHGIGVVQLPDCAHLAPFDAPSAFADAVDLVQGQELPAPTDDGSGAAQGVTSLDVGAPR